MSEIRFEQAQFFIKEVDKIKIYEQRFYEISRLFQKNPILQMMRWDLYDKIMDLHEPIYEKDFSKFLFKKLDECFEEVEEMQKDKKLENIKKDITDMIKVCNEKSIKF